MLKVLMTRGRSSFFSCSLDQSKLCLDETQHVSLDIHVASLQAYAGVTNRRSGISENSDG